MEQKRPGVRKGTKKEHLLPCMIKGCLNARWRGYKMCFEHWFKKKRKPLPTISDTRVIVHRGILPMTDREKRLLIERIKSEKKEEK